MKEAIEAKLLTRALLTCGAIAGPLFMVVVLVQDYTRAGFNPRVQPLSQLSLGQFGFIQIANFILAGILNLCYAVGLWRTLHPGRAGTWGPLLIGAYALGLVTVGLFTPDPFPGFPPGMSVPTQATLHGILHGVGGLFVFVTLAAALFVFARWFWGRREQWWSYWCIISSSLLLALFFIGLGNRDLTALLLRLGVVFGWGASSIIAIRVLKASRTARRNS